MDDIGIDIGLGGHHIGSDAITEGAYGYFSTSACDKGSDGEYQRDKCRAVTGVWEPGEMALFISSLAGRYEDALASVNNVIEGRIYFIAETPDGQLVASRPGSYNIVTEEYYLTPDDNDYSYVAPKALARDAVAELLAKDQQDVTVRFFVKVDAPAPAVEPGVQQDEVPEPRGDVSTGDVSDQAAGGEPVEVDVSRDPAELEGTGPTGEITPKGEGTGSAETDVGANLQQDAETVTGDGQPQDVERQREAGTDSIRTDSDSGSEETQEQLPGEEEAMGEETLTVPGPAVTPVVAKSEVGKELPEGQDSSESQGTETHDGLNVEQESAAVLSEVESTLKDREEGGRGAEQHSEGPQQEQDSKSLIPEEKLEEESGVLGPEGEALDSRATGLSGPSENEGTDSTLNGELGGALQEAEPGSSGENTIAALEEGTEDDEDVLIGNFLGL